MGTTATSEPAPAAGATLAVELLTARCREELARYRRGEAHDGRFCLELFRRAVVDRDDDCWRELVALFQDQVLAWSWSSVAGAARPCSVLPFDDAEELACVAWEQFWRYYSAEKLAEAGSVGEVLAYLKRCARTSAADAVRRQRPAQSLDWAAIEPPDRCLGPAEAQAEHDACSRLWAIVNASLRDRRERLLVYLTFEAGLRCAEIRAQRPDLFPSIVDFYQMKRNILDRLRRSHELDAWLSEARL